jgi:GntR family transcriptional regulator, transcriptional repressor for pyruvate dehydrogenase complex
MHKDLLHNKIVRELLGRIYSGQYEPDYKLPAERILCAELEVSRGTVREAMSNLASLGVIDIRHGSGAYVRQIKRETIPGTFLPPDFNNVTISDILIARKAIETATAQLACERIGAAGIKELRRLIGCMEASLDNLPLFLKYDMDFHYAIVRAAGNRPLEMAFAAIYEYHKYSMVFTSRHPGDEAAALTYHRRMFNAIERKDVADAAMAVSEHLEAMVTTAAKRNSSRRKKVK